MNEYNQITGAYLGLNSGAMGALNTSNFENRILAPTIVGQSITVSTL